MWYLDDGILCGTMETVGDANITKQRLPDIGLEPNLSKCKLFGAEVNEPSFDGITFQ